MRSLTNIIDTALEIVGVHKTDYFKTSGRSILDQVANDLIYINNWQGLIKEVEVEFDDEGLASIPLDLVRIIDVFNQHRIVPIGNYTTAQQRIAGLTIYGSKLRKVDKGLPNNLILAYVSNQWLQTNEYEVIEDLDDNVRLMLKMFIGTMFAVPTDSNPLVETGFVDWEWCRGQTLLVSEYPELYRVLGNKWGGEKDIDFNLPDARNRVLRNEGEDMEIGYQEDAGQKITGNISDLGLANSTGYIKFFGKSGAFDGVEGLTSFSVASSTTLETGMRSFSFDSSRVTRTAEETRVKSLGVNYWIITRTDRGAKKIIKYTNSISNVGNLDETYSLLPEDLIQRLFIIKTYEAKGMMEQASIERQEYERRLDNIINENNSSSPIRIS